MLQSYFGSPWLEFVIVFSRLKLEEAMTATKDTAESSLLKTVDRSASSLFPTSAVVALDVDSTAIADAIRSAIEPVMKSGSTAIDYTAPDDISVAIFNTTSGRVVYTTCVAEK